MYGNNQLLVASCSSPCLVCHVENKAAAALIQDIVKVQGNALLMPCTVTARPTDLCDIETGEKQIRARCCITFNNVLNVSSR